MDLKKVKPSKNFEDQTGYTDLQKFLDKWLTRANPVDAVKHVRDTVKYGAPARPQNLDLHNVKPSKNFEDRTGQDLSEIDWNYVLGMDALRNAGVDPNEALRGLPPEEVNNILFQRAWDAHGGTMMDDIRKGFPSKSHVNTNNAWEPMPKDWQEAWKNRTKK